MSREYTHQNPRGRGRPTGATGTPKRSAAQPQPDEAGPKAILEVQDSEGNSLLLTPLQASALRMRALGCTYRQIASAINVSMPTLRKYLKDLDGVKVPVPDLDLLRTRLQSMAFDALSVGEAILNLDTPGVDWSTRERFATKVMNSLGILVEYAPQSQATDALANLMNNAAKALGARDAKDLGIQEIDGEYEVSGVDGFGESVSDGGSEVGASGVDDTAEEA